MAIARAIVTNPAIVLADEPTGALDTVTSREIMAIFQRLNEERELTTVFVTHERDIALHTKREVQIRDGKIVADDQVGERLLATGAAETTQVTP